MLKHVIIGTLLSFSLSAGALAEEAASGKQVAPNHNVGDPNERICENITPIGCRLATRDSAARGRSGRIASDRIARPWKVPRKAPA